MAWNGSTDGRTTSKMSPQEKNKANALSRFPCQRGLTAGLIVIALGGAALFWFAGRGRSPSVQTEDRGGARFTTKIADVAPTITTNQIKEPTPKVIDPNARPTKIGEVVNGYVLLPSGRLHKRTGVITNSYAKANKPKYAIFERRCNNNIATLLMLKPGDSLVGTPRYNGRFKQDFIESLKEPIIVGHDDTPEVAQLKRDVIDVRLKLKEAMDRGEDIEQIMLDTRKELQDVANAKMALRKVFNEEKKNCKSEQDVEDLLTACNKMLEEKGIAPLKCNTITRRNLLRTQQSEQAPDNS